MDPHLILEVPDTPERLVQLVESSSVSSPMETNFSPLPQHQDTDHVLLENSCHSRDFGSRDVSRTSKTDQTKLIYRKEKLGQVYSGILDKRPLLGSSSQVGQTRVERTDLKYDTLATRNDDIFKVAERKIQKNSLGENNKLLRSHGRDGLLLSQSSVGQPESETDIILSRKGKRILQDSGMKFQEKGKGVSLSCDSHSESHCELSSATHDGISQKPRVQRRLVRNGCISPCNIARTRNASEVHSQNGTIYSNGRKFYPATDISGRHKNHGDNRAVSHPVDEREEIELIGMLNNVSSSRQPLTAPDSEVKHNDHDKGKTICDTMMTDRQPGNLPPYR